MDRIKVRDISELLPGRQEISQKAKRKCVWNPLANQQVPQSSPERNHGRGVESDSGEELGLFGPRARGFAMDTPEDQPGAATSYPVVITPEAAATAATSGVAVDPDSLYDFHWKSFPTTTIPLESRREPFLESSVGPTSPCADPYDSFTAIWDRDFMEYIATVANRDARQFSIALCASNNLHRNNFSIGEWKDTNADELYVYLGIVIAMCIMSESNLEELWQTKCDIFSTPGFKVHMSLRRFEILNRCIHFKDKRNMYEMQLTPFQTKLYKIQPVMSHLNQRFQELYNLNRNIALDGSLRVGCLTNNQFNPNEAAPVMIKSYEICDLPTGYMWRFQFKADPRANQQNQHSDSLEASSVEIILELVQGLENKGHTLWMDSTYNSPVLARKLKRLGFDCAGTFRTNQKYVPEFLRNLSKTNMKRSLVACRTSGDVDLMVWRDSNEVGTISTYHGDSVAMVNGVVNPLITHESKVMMRELNKKNKILAMKPVEKKRVNVLCQKIFRKLLHVSILNSFIIVKASVPTMTYSSFRKRLVSSLLGRHMMKPPNPTLCNVASVTAQNPDRLFEAYKHYLDELPLLTTVSDRIRQACVVCKKWTGLCCVACDKPLCFKPPCFSNFHKP